MLDRLRKHLEARIFHAIRHAPHTPVEEWQQIREIAGVLSLLEGAGESAASRLLHETEAARVVSAVLEDADFLGYERRSPEAAKDPANQVLIERRRTAEAREGERERANEPALEPPGAAPIEPSRWKLLGHALARVVGHETEGTGLLDRERETGRRS